MSIVRRAREIQTGEFAEVLDGRTVIGSRCILCILKPSKPDFFAINFYIRLVKTLITDALVSSGIIRLPTSILTILSGSCFSKVRAAIIQRVVIDVVYLMRCAENLAVHLDSSTFCGFASISYRNPTLTALNVQRTPIPVHEPFIVGSIDDGIFSASQWDKAIRWIKRLDNIMSWHGAFHKEPSFLVRLSAALSNFTTSWEAA